MSSYEDYQPFRYGGLALYAITAVASSVICSMSLCQLRRWGDPVRRFLRWQKATFVIFTTSLYFYAAAYATSVAAWQVVIDETGDYYAVPRILGTAAAYLFSIGAFLFGTAQILIFCMLVGLGAGISMANNGGAAPQTGVKKFVKPAAYATAGLLMCLNIAIFGLNVTGDTFSQVFGMVNTSNVYYVHSNRVLLAMYVLLMVLSLALATWAGKARFRSGAQEPEKTRMASTYFLLCGFLFLLNCVYEIGVLGDSGSLDTNSSSSGGKPYLYITGVILSAWPCFIILILLHVLGKKQDGGLWSPGVVYNPSQQQQQYAGQPPMYNYPPQQQQQQPVMMGAPMQSVYPVSPMSPQQLGPDGVPVQQLGPNLTPQSPQLQQQQMYQFHQQQHPQQPSVWYEMPDQSYKPPVESKPAS